MKFFVYSILQICFFHRIFGAPCDSRNTDRIPDEQRLLCEILRHYNPLTRPVKNSSTVIKIGLGLAVNQIFELDEKNQMLITNVWIDHEWTDEFLNWDPQKFGGIYTIRIPAGRIWTPDIVLYNNAADYATKPVDIRAMISHDGNVFLGVPVKLYSSCTIDVTYFPFDTQKCRLKFGSWTYDGWKVDLHGRVGEVDLSRFVLNGEWDVLSAYQVRHVVKYTCCEEPYIDLTFYINMRRKTLYYLFNVFFPTFIMSSLTLLTFLLPPDSGEKCALGITVLLSFSVFMLSVTEKLPETSEFIPLISIYLTAVMSMSAISVCLTVLVLSLHYRPSLGVRRRPPKFCRLLIRFCNKEDMKASQEISPADEAIRRVEGNLLRYRKSMVSFGGIDDPPPSQFHHHHASIRNGAATPNRWGTGVSSRLARNGEEDDLLVHMNRPAMFEEEDDGEDTLVDASMYLMSSGVSFQARKSNRGRVNEFFSDEDDDDIDLPTGYNIRSSKSFDNPARRSAMGANGSAKYQSFAPSMLPRMMNAVGIGPGNMPPYHPGSSTRIQKLYEEIAEAIDRLTSQYAVEADSARSLREWQSLARAVDRILFWSFVIITLTSTVALLVVTPAVHNAILEAARQQEADTQRQESLQAMVSGTGPELEAAIAASQLALQQAQQTVTLTSSLKDAPLPGVNSEVIIDLANAQKSI